MEYRYEKCPRCGLSNGTDDKILSSKIIDTSYNGGEITILEERKCDICQKVYKIEMHVVLMPTDIYTCIQIFRYDFPYLADKIKERDYIDIRKV